jgi:predicted nucleotidyltransferase
VALRQHADAVRRIANLHGAEDVRVFGSVARGDDRVDSDIDLLVRLRPGVSLLDLVELTDELEGLFGRTVDVVSEAGLRDSDERIRTEAVPL